MKDELSWRRIKVCLESRNNSKAEVAHVSSSWRKTRKRMVGRGGNISGSSCQCKWGKTRCSCSIPINEAGVSFAQLMSDTAWNQKLDWSHIIPTTAHVWDVWQLYTMNFWQQRAVVKPWKSCLMALCKSYSGLEVPDWRMGTAATYDSTCCLSNHRVAHPSVVDTPEQCFFLLIPSSSTPETQVAEMSLQQGWKVWGRELSRGCIQLSWSHLVLGKFWGLQAFPSLHSFSK